VRVLTTEDIVALVRRLLDLPVKLGLDHEAKRPRGRGVLDETVTRFAASLTSNEHFGKPYVCAR